MKINTSIILLLALSIFSQCVSTKPTPKLPDNLDARLLGSWSGSEKNQLMQGVESTWIQHRFDNGEFLLLAIYNQNGRIITGSEKGRWWIENGLFHELHYSTNKTDIYEYEVLNEDQVKFKAKKMSFKTNAEVYEFVDTRVID